MIRIIKDRIDMSGAFYPSDFDNAYYNNGRAAETYTRPNTDSTN